MKTTTIALAAIAALAASSSAQSLVPILRSGTSISLLRARDGAIITATFTSNASNIDFNGNITSPIRFTNGWSTTGTTGQLAYTLVFSSPIDIAQDLQYWTAVGDVGDPSPEATSTITVSGGTATRSSLSFFANGGGGSGSIYNAGTGVTTFNGYNGTQDYSVFIPGTGTATTFSMVMTNVERGDYTGADFVLKGFTQVIPEPSSTALLGFAALGLITRRKR